MAATDMLTIGDVASRLRVSERTIRNWVAEGLFIAPERVGRRSVRWRPADVDAWLASHAADGRVAE